MLNVVQEIRLSLRRLRKSPSFSMTALVTLSVGLGTTVTVFGLLSALLFSPLQVPESHRLYSVQHQHDLNNSYLDYKDLRDRNTVFSSLALLRLTRVGLETISGADPVWGYEISGNYFDTLKIHPFLGRFLQPSDEHAKDADPDIVLSYDYWRQRFGGDATIIGRTIRVNKFPYTVIGVAPQGFHGTERVVQAEVWLPVLNETSFEGFNWIEHRAAANAWIIGRLKPGISPQAAEAELDNIAGQMASEHPDVDERRDYQLSQPGLLGNTLGAPVQRLGLGIMLLAALQLIAACANLGSLFAARTSDGKRELAIQVALGASRIAVFRALLVEALLVSLIACAFAMIVARLTLQAFSQWRPVSALPVQLEAHSGVPVYVFAFCLSIATGILFGVLSARDVWRIDPNFAIRSTNRSALAERGLGLRDILLGVQIAVCCLLVTTCFVSIAGLRKLAGARLGFETQGVYLASLDLRLANYKESDVSGIQKRLLDATAALPGVSRSAYGNTTPLALDQSSTTIVPESVGPFGSDGNKAFPNKLIAPSYQVSPEYLSVLTIPIIAGRDFTWQDNATSRRVAIISQTLANELYGREVPIGRQFYSQAQGPDPWEIVGIVQDGKFQTFGHDASAVFFPILQVPSTSTILLARSSLRPEQVIPEMRQGIASVDSGIPVLTLNSWTDSLHFVLFPARAVTVILGAFGVITLLLAVTGIFGLAASTVSRRLRDLGIRMALGARPVQIALVVLKRTVVLLTVGSALGFVLGYLVSNVIASIIYQSTTNLLWLLSMVAATMLATGALATWLPLRRALSANARDLLRSE